MFVSVAPSEIGADVAVGSEVGEGAAVGVALSPPHAAAIKAVAVSISSRAGPISRFLTVISPLISTLAATPN